MNATETTPETAAQPPTALERLAGAMYTAYCAAVGGKAFNGDPLPDWQNFRADPFRREQYQGWIAAAAAIGEGTHFVRVQARQLYRP
jgi:hypothetical protein